MNLNSIFTSVAYKQLAQVDLSEGSNQHEINGTKTLQKFFETTEPFSGQIRWHFFDDEDNTQQSLGNFTFYDARKRSAARTKRSEWRMYYSGEFISKARPGDILILARTVDYKIYGLILKENSGWLRAAQGLFNIDKVRNQIKLLPDKSLYSQQVEFSQEQILNELGIEYEPPINTLIEDIASRELNRVKSQNKEFPNTAEMSSLAQTNTTVDISSPDASLVIWLDFEEKLFRTIEKSIVQEKIDLGFDSVDDFMKYSLSTQNRRKSRMGYALQNHLKHLFNLHKLQFDTQKTTEGKNTPDFLFPGQKEYLDESFDEKYLVMLAAKSSCKERWRQILTEAKRIPHKHLCTLEQSISKDQMDEMSVQKVQLVVPEQLHELYPTNQQTQLLTVGQFIEFVKEKQSIDFRI